MKKSKAKIGFTYLIEVIDKSTGKVLDSEIVKNIIPVQGLNYMLGASIAGTSQITAWYIGLYENAYTPLPTDTAATFPGTAGESTAYDETARQALVCGAASGGVIDNSANPAEFTFNASKSIAGGFIASSSPKGSTAGVLISAVRFSSPKSVDDGAILRVTAGLQLISE